MRDSKPADSFHQSPAAGGRGKARWLILLACAGVVYAAAAPWLEQRLGAPLPRIWESPAPVADRADRADAPEAPPSLDDTRSTAGSAAGQLQPQGAALVSEAGLRYATGGADGGRVAHVMRHAADMPERPIHGVFDASGRREVVAVIDEAYQKSLGDQAEVERRRQRDRMVLTVEMGRRIGYVGGQAGRRQNYPPCSKLRLVLEGREVITAYPVGR